MGRLSIYMHEDGRSAVHNEGFSWTAAVSAPIWALHRRLYKTSVALFPAVLFLHDAVNRALLHIADESLRGGLAIGWFLLISLLAGWFANTWHLHVLRKGGYVLTATE